VTPEGAIGMESNISGRVLLNRYELHERLGRGGMGEVYRGIDRNLDRAVAVKVLHGHLADEEGFRARFEREAKTMASLNHRLLASVFDYGCDDETGAYLIVMEYLSGGMLEDRMQMLAAQTLPVRLEAVHNWFLPLLDAVDYAHQRGLIHRDIKPSNVLFNEADEPVLADFGLARIVSSERLTATGLTIGTPAYMAPEQGMGQSGDPRSDLYSLGVMLYEMLAGDTPFHADTPFGVIMAHVNEPLPSLKERLPDLPVALDSVVSRALVKQPEMRYQSAGQFRTALNAALSGEVSGAPSTVQFDAVEPAIPADERPTTLMLTLTHTLSIPIQAVRHHPWIMWGGLAILAAILAITLIFNRPSGAAATPAPTEVVEAAGGLPAMTVPDSGTGGSIESMAEPTDLADTFDDPASGWPVLETGAITYGYADGRYLFTNRAPAEGATAIFNQTYTFSDTYLEVQAQLLEGQAASAYGLIFRYQDESNFYVFTVSGMGQASIWALENGSWRELRGEGWTDSAAISIEEPNLLTVVAEGDHLIGLVNGEHVIDLNDDTYQEGAVGFYVATTTGSVSDPLAEVAFDDFVARHNIPAMTAP